jgi:putative ubiquitin-RnfH superfamily antitoxin RatB of RatAB toxin-antitoxin module
MKSTLKEQLLTMTQIKVSVAFATPELQKIITLSLTENSTIVDAVTQSKLNDYFLEYDFSTLAVGIFGKRIFNPKTHIVKNGDRIEIYRPLLQSPNQKRLERAKQQ